MLQHTIWPWRADVLQNSSIAHDASDWLARNNSYIRTSGTGTNPAMLQPCVWLRDQGNTDNTGKVSLLFLASHTI